MDVYLPFRLQSIRKAGEESLRSRHLYQHVLQEFGECREYRLRWQFFSGQLCLHCNGVSPEGTEAALEDITLKDRPVVG